MEKMWYVYILQCADNSHYIGCTNDIIRRLYDHNSHKVHYTKDKIPVSIITYVAFSDKYKAFEFERYLKTGSGIAFRRRHLI
jgi:predicted GIY-YIG superfamily endonuclease